MPSTSNACVALSVRFVTSPGQQSSIHASPVKCCCYGHYKYSTHPCSRNPSLLITVPAAADSRPTAAAISSWSPPALFIKTSSPTPLPSSCLPALHPAIPGAQTSVATPISTATRPLLRSTSCQAVRLLRLQGAAKSLSSTNKRPSTALQSPSASASDLPSVVFRLSVQASV